jgi:hypothetical protein
MVADAFVTNHQRLTYQSLDQGVLDTLPGPRDNCAT